MHNQLIPLINLTNSLTPGQNIETYLKTVQSMPLLSAAEEKKLAEKLNTDHDLNSARELILSSLRYVVPVARSYSGYGLPLADLIQEGNIGLMKAVKRFRASENVRLMTFAIHWIRAEMNEYVIKNWRIVKTATTKAQRKLFFKLRSSKKTLEWFGDKDADRVAKDLGVTRKDVLEMETRLYGKDLPVDMSNDEEENEHKTYPILISNEPGPEASLVMSSTKKHQTMQLAKALKILDDRSKTIIQKRWLTDNKTGLKELSLQYGVSMERIRQVEQQAIKKMRLAIGN